MTNLLTKRQKVNRRKLYMTVDFHDNDFGWPVQNAVEKLWKFINDNNGHITNDRSVPEMFIELHEADKLVPMIDRLYQAEHIACDVEFETRGLYWEEVKWEEKIVPKELVYHGYLDFNVEFRETPIPSDKWNNGESIQLDLVTGKCKSY